MARQQPWHRFWSRVDIRGPNECWEWQGGTDGGKGYGRIRWGSPRKIRVGAHRVSWELHHGPIPDGMLVCHTCDNKPCVNPAHLFLGTNQDNLRDAAHKGRMARGEHQSSSKLTEPEVLEIYRRYWWGDSRNVLAQEFGVSRASIWNIGTGKCWGWLTNP